MEGFKIVNANGVFPLDIPRMRKSRRMVRREGEAYSQYMAGATVSQSGLQLHSLTDGVGNPFLYAITEPGGETVISFEETAIALLMSTPYLMPADETDYRNTVDLLRRLKSFDGYVQRVRDVYYDARAHHRSPDYSQANPVPVFSELYDMTRDNRELTLSGLSLKGLQVTPLQAKFKLHNRYKRSVAVFASRVKMNDAGLIETDREQISPTFSDIIIKLSDYLVKLENKEVKANLKDVEPEDGAMIASVGIMLKELAKLTASDPTLRQEFPIWVPFLMESGKSDYFDIVLDARWDLYFKSYLNPFGDDEEWLQSNEESIFEKDSRELTFDFKGYDKLCLDVYGLGLLGDKEWGDLSFDDQARIIFVLMYGGYFDVIQPMTKLITGLKKWNKSSGGGGSELGDASQHVSEVGIVAKLLLEFARNPKNLTDLYDKAHKEDIRGIVKNVSKFTIKEMAKLPQEAETLIGGNHAGEALYIELMYHIARTKLGFSKSYEDFAGIIVNCAAPLIEMCNVALKTIEACEATMDIVGGLHALKNSELKQSFYIDRFDQPFIEVTEPASVFLTPDVEVNFAWNMHQGKNYGQNYAYNIEVLTENPQTVSRDIVQRDLKEPSCSLYVASIPSARQATRVSYRIIAHHPDNSSHIEAMTDFIPLVQNVALYSQQPPEMVDMGLPSGTLWASCNLGASAYYECGDYYAWGETSPKDNYTWRNYKHARGSASTLTKYCTKGSYGQADGRTQLEAADDKVKSDYGYYYSIPTREDWEELLTHCEWVRTAGGYTVTGRTERHPVIFLPLCGYRDGRTLYDAEAEGYYWTSTLDEGSPDDAWYVHLSGGKAAMGSYYRSQGRCIRPVMHKATYGLPGTEQ